MCLHCFLKLLERKERLLELSSCTSLQRNQGKSLQRKMLEMQRCMKEMGERVLKAKSHSTGYWFLLPALSFQNRFLTNLRRGEGLSHLLVISTRKPCRL